MPSPHAVHAIGEHGYSGEVWLAKRRGSLEYEVGVNQIRVVANVTGHDVLMINQNWFPGWEAAGTVTGPLVPRRGLASIALPRGEHELVVRFRQRSVPVGFALGIGVVLVALAALGARRWTKGPRNAVGVPEIAALVVAVVSLLAIPLGARLGILGAVPAGLDPARRGALIVDATEGSEFPTIQAAIDASMPGDLILVKDGEYPGFRLDSGVTILAEHPNGARIVGENITIESVPPGFPAQVVGLEFTSREHSTSVKDCGGTVLLQEVVVPGDRTEDGIALHVGRCASLHLARSRVGTTRVRGGFLRVSHSTIEAAPDHASAIDAQDGVVTLHESTVVGNDGPAIAALRTRVDLVSAEGGSLRRSGAGPLVRARQASWIRLSDARLTNADVDIDELRFLQFFSPNLPTVSFRTTPSFRSEIELEVKGPPHSSGTVIVSAVDALSEAQGSRQWALANLGPMNLYLPFTIPESGRVQIDTEVQGTQWNVGWPLFAQVAVESRDANSGVAQTRFSLLDAAVVRP